MAELEDFFDKSIRKQRRTKACERRKRAKEKESQLQRPAEERPPEEVAHEEKS